jgi:hypothetical protein
MSCPSLRLVAIMAVVMTAKGLVTNAAGPANFKADGMVTGSTLAGWHILGDADWKAQNGELVGTAKPGGSGGWLVMDKSFQDVQLYANYRCTGVCTSGVLLRAQKTPDGGMSGVYVSLTDGDTASYVVTIDAQGKELTRERLAAPAGRGAGGGAARGTAAATPPATGGQPGATAAGRATPPGTQVGSSGSARRR